MKVTDIDKCIKLLDNAEIANLRDFLVFQRQIAIMDENKADTKQITAIKKVLNANTKARPILNSCQHTSDGSQFICEGYFAVLWKNYNDMLDGLNQVDSDQSIKFNSIWKSYEVVDTIEVTDDELLLIKNARKYDKINKYSYLYVLNRLFRSSYIADMYDIIFKYIDLKSARIYASENESEPIYIETDEVKIILLPCRCEKCEREDQIEKQKDFLNKIKGN